MYRILEKDSEEDLSHQIQHPKAILPQKKDNTIFEERGEEGINQSKRIMLCLCRVLMDHY